MKICILSDSHDHRVLLSNAVAAAKDAGAEAVLHCGDVVAPSTLRVLQKFGLPVHAIHGNNVGDLVHMAKYANEPGSVLRFHGQDAGIVLHGRRIFLVHYPHYARALALTGDWDLVCCGHDHRAEVTRVENILGRDTILLNPGTVAGIGARATYALADLATWEISIHDVVNP